MATLTTVISDDTAATTEIDLTEYVSGSLTEVTAADISLPDGETTSLTVVDTDDPEEVGDDEIAVVSDTSVVIGTDLPEGTTLVIASDLLDNGADDDTQATVGDERAL